MVVFTAQRTEEILMAAAIMRRLRADALTQGMLALWAEGAEAAMRDNDVDKYVRLKRCMRKIRDETNDSDLKAALSGVIYLLCPH